jgi:hypothetical protein
MSFSKLFCFFIGVIFPGDIPPELLGDRFEVEKLGTIFSGKPARLILKSLNFLVIFFAEHVTDYREGLMLFADLLPWTWMRKMRKMKKTKQIQIAHHYQCDWVWL